jgi:hypothetical protein
MTGGLVNLMAYEKAEEHVRFIDVKIKGGLA